MRFSSAAARCLLILGLATANSLAETSDLARTGSIIHLPGLEIRGGDKKSIEATGRVSLTTGILEFVAVESGGRDYESLFTLDCKPSALKFALLLIGCETGAVPHEVKSGARVGDRLHLEVEWQSDGKSKRLPVEKLLVDRKKKKSPAELPWVFTGSRFVKDIEGREVFLADSEQAFISLWWNPAVLINVGSEFGNPYHGDDQGFEVNAAEIPPKNTPIKLILRKVSE
jgi:hypothetical protein